ncbi:hypothetical protein U1872_08695 [Sphingomonas sp. RB3P16]|uniref:hypothetical protein n=1 Tax=Parasphingomonas frigoris TaxID=3096163 RepID=UPI002FC5F83F
MTMLTGLLVFAMIVLRRFPETGAARWLERAITATAAALRRVERRHLIFALILTTFILIASAELLALIGPFDIALVLMWDVSVYVDIVLTSAVVATATRGGAGWRMIVARFTARPRARARRQRVARKPAAPANEDERGDFALAA